jgi:membrane protein
VKKVGELVLATLAAFVAVGALFRRTEPVPGTVPASPYPSLSTDAGMERPASPVAEDGPKQAGVVGFAKELIQAVSRHRLTMLSAGLAYYGFFTMFPLTIAAVSIYGLMGDPADLEAMFDRVTSVFPAPTAQFLNDQLDTLFNASASGLGLATGVSLLVTLWSASASVRALMIGIDAVYEESTEGRGLMVRLWALVSTLALLLVVAILVALAALLPRILDALGLEGGNATLISLIRWPVLLVMITVGLTFLYRSSPSSSVRRDGWFSLGAALATVAILVATVGLSWLVAVSDYGSVYGALTGLALLMLWFFTAGVVVLVGAEIDRMINELRRASPVDPVVAR